MANQPELAIKPDNRKKTVIVAPNHQQVFYYMDEVARLLDKQSLSYQSVWTFEDIKERLFTGHLFVWFYVEDEEILGMSLMSLNKYSECIFSIKIEFLSCENFLRITDMIDVLETRAIQIGATFVEAVAHPTIAKYAVKKKGYEAPATYIRKTLKRRMM